MIEIYAAIVTVLLVILLIINKMNNTRRNYGKVISVYKENYNYFVTVEYEFEDNIITKTVMIENFDFINNKEPFNIGDKIIV